ncbi:MAG: hypothetical protein WC628_03530 [Candidatus Omnitrophota bacterium]
MKYRYSINSDNQLVISTGLGRKPILCRGRFSVDKKNSLIYLVNEPPAWRRIYSLPGKIVFFGNWSLDANHDLELRLEQNNAQHRGDLLTLKGNIISVDRGALAFEIRQASTGQQPDSQEASFCILKLSVTWLADTANRLCFIVNKPSPDIISLRGSWQVNKNQEIVYNYERRDLLRKVKEINTLTFEGFWEINSANRLSYIFKYSPDSKFEFCAFLESPSIYPQTGKIKYRIGAGIRESGAKEKIISLYGVWKFSRNLGLNFQMDYGKGEVREISFGTEVKFNRANQIVFALNNESGEPLGISLIFTHRFLKALDAQAFLRLKQLQGSASVDFAVRIPF